MRPQDTTKMYPLADALEVAGVKPGKFHRHFYGGALGNALAQAGELSDHVSDPKRGAGVGRGGGRFVTSTGAICLGIFFRLVSGGVHSAQAIQIAQTFSFLGETGDGLRAFKHGTPRPAGTLFPGYADTLLVAISDSAQSDLGDTQSFAFVPGSEFDARSLAEWLALHDAEKSPVCAFNISEVCREILASLAACRSKAFAVDSKQDRPTASWSEMTSDPVGAFLVDCAVRDDKARTPTQEFFRAFDNWHSGWTGAPFHQDQGLLAGRATLHDGLNSLGIRKVKSNGIMTYAGFRWRDTPAVHEYLAVGT